MATSRPTLVAVLELVHPPRARHLLGLISLVTSCASQRPTLAIEPPLDESARALFADVWEAKELSALQGRFGQLAGPMSQQLEQAKAQIYGRGPIPYREAEAAWAKATLAAASSAFALIKETRPAWAELLRAKEEGRTRLEQLAKRLPARSEARRLLDPLRALLDQQLVSLRALLALADGPLDVAPLRRLFEGLRTPATELNPSWRPDFGLPELVELLTDCRAPANGSPRSCAFSPRLYGYGLGVPSGWERSEPWPDASVQAVWDDRPRDRGTTYGGWPRFVRDLSLVEVLRLSRLVDQVAHEDPDIGPFNFWTHPSLRYDASRRTLVERFVSQESLLPGAFTDSSGLPGWRREQATGALTREEVAEWMRELLKSGTPAQ